MTKTPERVKPVSTSVALLVLAILIAGIASVPYRSTRAPEGVPMNGPRPSMATIAMRLSLPTWII